MPEQLEFPWAAPAPFRNAPAPRAENPKAAPGKTQAKMPPRPASETCEATERLFETLNQRIPGPVFLRITNNASSIISARRRPDGVLQVHLHHMFLHAPEQVVNALAQWVIKPRARSAGDVVDAFIRENKGLIQPRRRRVIRCCPRGRNHDLRDLLNEINAAHFDSKVEAYITWGAMPRKIQRRSIRFGSYSPRDKVIRIHPLLDQDFVPCWFVRYIVFHEMLHVHLGIAETISGRRSMHPPEFKRMERAYPDYERAVAWIENPDNMRRLLRYPPRK